jgi:hypothetical protein
MGSMKLPPFMRRYRDKISQKLKVLDQEKLCGIPWTFVKFCKIVFPILVYFHESYRHSAIIRQHLTVFPSYFINILLKYFGILLNLMRFYESWQKLWYSMTFFGPITYFCSILFNCNVLLAFCNFVPWWTKFFCLLSYRFASRQYRQIFRHCQKRWYFQPMSSLGEGIFPLS